MNVHEPINFHSLTLFINSLVTSRCLVNIFHVFAMSSSNFGKIEIILNLRDLFRIFSFVIELQSASNSLFSWKQMKTVWHHDQWGTYSYKQNYKEISIKTYVQNRYEGHPRPKDSNFWARWPWFIIYGAYHKLQFWASWCLSTRHWFKD